MTKAPPRSADFATLAIGDKFPMNSWLTSENAVNATYARVTFYEVGRIEVGHSLALDTGTSSRTTRFPLNWAHLDPTIMPSSNTSRGMRVGKEEDLWPSAWK